MDSSRLTLPSSFVVILASQLSAVHEHQEVKRPSPGPGRSTDDNRIVVRLIFSTARTDIACTKQREVSCHGLADLVGGKRVQNLGKIRGHARGPGSGGLRQRATRRPGDGRRATVRECGAQ